jgi:hypothetical protein
MIPLMPSGSERCASGAMTLRARLRAERNDVRGAHLWQGQVDAAHPCPPPIPRNLDQAAAYAKPTGRPPHHTAEA